MGLTPFSCFFPKRRFENQNPTKTKKQALCFSLLFDLFVLEVGIEPTLPKELDFESSASTNSATRAIMVCKSKKYFMNVRFNLKNSSNNFTFVLYIKN